jgi:hypothetical protein
MNDELIKRAEGWLDSHSEREKAAGWAIQSPEKDIIQDLLTALKGKG